MPASPLDSAIYGKLLADGDTARLFSDSAEVRALLLVLGALAKVQGELGLIPETSARFIHRASMELQLDPSGLAAQVSGTGAVSPALLSAFRKALEAPEHGQHLGCGVTPDAIEDTARALLLKRIFESWQNGLQSLPQIRDEHAAALLPARTVALSVTLTGTGDHTPAQTASTARALAEALGLPTQDPDGPPPSLAPLARWAAAIAGPLADAAAKTAPATAPTAEALARQVQAQAQLLSAIPAPPSGADRLTTLFALPTLCIALSRLIALASPEAAQP